MSADDIRAVLAAYKQVMDASWPALHPAMATRAGEWSAATEEDLAAELAGYLRDASAPSCGVRVFWKLGPKFLFGGCNEHFAHDAGLLTAQLIGLDDFDQRLPWALQAAKYRADDEDVFKSGRPKLDIMERQKAADGVIVWVHAGKAPIRAATGKVLGILGMYEVLDAETGRRLYAEKHAIRKPKS